MGLFLGPLILLPMGYAALSETPGHLRYFPIVVAGVAVFIFWGYRRYRKLKTFYHKVENWPYTSKEALIEARSAVITRLPKLYGVPPLYGLMLFSSLVNIFKEDTRQFFSNLFHLRNPFEAVAVYVPFILIGVPILVIFFGKMSHERFLNKNYRAPLDRLQEIIDRF